MVELERRDNQMLDELSRLYKQRQQTISQCVAFQIPSPDLVEVMDWVLTVGLEATEEERANV